MNHSVEFFNKTFAELNSTKRECQRLSAEKNAMYFELMGRLIKADPANREQYFNEVLDYAVKFCTYPTNDGMFEGKINLGRVKMSDFPDAWKIDKTKSEYSKMEDYVKIKLTCAEEECEEPLLQSAIDDAVFVETLEKIINETVAVSDAVKPKRKYTRKPKVAVAV